MPSYHLNDVERSRLREETGLLCLRVRSFTAARDIIKARLLDPHARTHLLRWAKTHHRDAADWDQCAAAEIILNLAGESLSAEPGNGLQPVVLTRPESAPRPSSKPRRAREPLKNGHRIIRTEGMILVNRCLAAGHSLQDVASIAPCRAQTVHHWLKGTHRMPDLARDRILKAFPEITLD
jgi:hypothetical protein